MIYNLFYLGGIIYSALFNRKLAKVLSIPDTNTRNCTAEPFNMQT